jgi:hypothetical protein
LLTAQKIRKFNSKCDRNATWQCAIGSLYAFGTDPLFFFCLEPIELVFAADETVRGQ